MKKPLIACIVRNWDLSDINGWKKAFEMNGYNAIVGNSLGDIPEDNIKDLDLLIAHLHDEKEPTLEEQKYLRKFYDSKFKFAIRIGADEWFLQNELSEDFGKIGNDYYVSPLANLLDAVKYFLSDGKSQNKK